MASSAEKMLSLALHEELRQAITAKNTWAAYNVIKQGIDINGIDVNIADENGFTLLHWATLDNNKAIVVSLLLKDNIHIDAEEKGYRTALYFSIQQQHVEVKDVLLKEGANPSTILHIAAYYNEVEKFFSDKRIQKYTNIRNRHGLTPLHIATLCRKQAAVEILLKTGAKINERDLNGYTPLDIAQKKNHPEITTLLLANGGRNGKGVINAIFLYLQFHRRKLQAKGHALVLLMTLFLSELKLMHLMYRYDDDDASIDKYAIALANTTQEKDGSPKISEKIAKCRFIFNLENVPILECHNLQEQTVTHYFSVETSVETAAPEYVRSASEKMPISNYVITPPLIAAENELNGEAYGPKKCKLIKYLDYEGLYCESDKNGFFSYYKETCKPVEYLGHKALHCEGNKTNHFVREIKQSDPLDVVNILNTINSILLLGIFGMLLMKFLCNQGTALSESADKRSELIIVSDNDSDLQNFFKEYMHDDKGKSEAESDAADMGDNDKGEADPFVHIMVNTKDSAFGAFLHAAKERLEQLELMLSSIQHEAYSYRRTHLFFQSRNSEVKNIIKFIRECLEDLEAEEQIPKSDLYRMALELNDLEEHVKFNEKEAFSLVGHAEDNAFRPFFQIAEERLKQIELKISKIKDDDSFKLTRFFLPSPPKLRVQEAITFIREILDDLKAEKQISGLDLHNIALDIIDLERRVQSNQKQALPLLKDITSSSVNTLLSSVMVSKP